MCAHKKQQVDVCKDRSITCLINKEISDRLKGNETLLWQDFDGKIRQCLHAIHGNGGLQEVRDALDALHISTCHKPRVWVQNPSGYIHKILKDFVRSVRKGCGSQRIRRGNLAISPGRVPPLPCIPMPALSPVALPPPPPLWSCEAQHSNATDLSRAAADSSGASYGHDPSTKSIQLMWMEDSVEQAKDPAGESLRAVLEVSGMPSAPCSESSSRRVIDMDGLSDTTELDTESISDTDCSLLLVPCDEDFLVVPDLRDEGLEQWELHSKYGELEQDEFVVL